MDQSKKHKIKKGFKIAGITLGSLLGVTVLALGSYAGYVFGQFYRIEDNQNIDVNKKVEKEVPLDKDLKITTFNAGFGAYSHNFTFFMDRGYYPNEEVKYGRSSIGHSKEEVIRNITRSMDVMKAMDSDFYAIQEVDLKSHRAHNVNQEEMFYEGFGKDKFDETFAINFHSAYLFYPLYEPHGKSTAGLQTLSKYKISEAVRKSYTISTDLMDKLFDLDRCFIYNRIPVSDSDKDLIIINSHMSAYDEGGVIRNQQIKELNEFMTSEVDKGNYVICSGDFNHDLITNNPNYPQYFEKDDKSDSNYCFQNEYKQARPYWTSKMFNEDKTHRFDERFSIYTSTKIPTYRGVNEEYVYGRTYISSVDGFIVSNNIKIDDPVTSVVGSPLAIDENDEHSKYFAYSDHQPATLTFQLDSSK